MPCTKDLQIDTSKPVLVTGGSGYIAGVLIAQLLEKGVTVHTTVRDPSQKDRLQYLQDIADKSKGTLQFFKADLTTKGDFEESIQGCSIVFHTASPYSFNVDDPTKDLVEPAVQGTENVLHQCNKTPSVKRVILTSSCLSIYCDANETNEANPTTEATWNRTASLTKNPYALSKTLAEQAAWVIAGGQTQWILCTMNPCLVVGPGVKYHASSESFKQVRSLGCNDPNMALGVPDIGLSCVDVRDVAAAHIAAAYSEEATGRHILSGPGCSMPEMAQAIGKKYSPDYPIVLTTVPLIMYYVLWLLSPLLGLGPRSFFANNWGYKAHFDNTKSKKELGMDYIPMETSLQEMWQQMIDAGAVETVKEAEAKKTK